MTLEKFQTSNILNNTEKLKWLDVQASQLKIFPKIIYSKKNYNIYNKLLLVNTFFSKFKDFEECNYCINWACHGFI